MRRAIIMVEHTSFRDARIIKLVVNCLNKLYNAKHKILYYRIIVRLGEQTTSVAIQLSDQNLCIDHSKKSHHLGC